MKMDVNERMSINVHAFSGFYSQNWTSSLGFKELQAWRPWTRDGEMKMGGYATRYANDFDFVTIRGAGHMVPEYKPEAALVMMRSFISKEDYPRYRPKRREQHLGTELRYV